VVIDRHGLLVQRKDAWLATRRSGFDSPVVHSGMDEFDWKVAGYGSCRAALLMRFPFGEWGFESLAFRFIALMVKRTITPRS
jgi:hypothetical protein